MNKKMLYTYATLRYVHDVVAGEFLNVGVTMLSPSNGRLLFSATTNFERVVRAFPNADRQALKSVAAMLQSNIDKLNAAGSANTTLEDMLAHVLPNDDSSFQWSSIGSGVTSDISLTLEELHHRFVDRFVLAYGAPQDATPRAIIESTQGKPIEPFKFDGLTKVLSLMGATFEHSDPSRTSYLNDGEWYNLTGCASASNDPYYSGWPQPAMGGAS